MSITERAAAQPPAWLLKVGVGAGVLLALAALRWLPGRRRRNTITRLRQQALKLTERIVDTAQERF